MKLKILKIFNRLTKREKKTVLVGSLVAVIIFLMLIASPLIKKKTEIKDFIETKEILLEKYKLAIAEKGQMSGDLDALKERFKGMEGTLLDGETPTLASVRLQNIIEKTAKKRKVQTKRVKTLKSKDMGDYHKVFVEITFSSDIASLVGFLYDVENNLKALSVSEVNMRFHKRRGVAELETVVTVEGAIRNVAMDINEKRTSSGKIKIKKERSI